MHSFEASSSVAAEPPAVWEVLTDAAGWPTWDSGVDSVEGRIAPGQKITIRAAVSPGRAFPVRVAAFDVASRIQLTGGIPLGLFRGVRTYTLSPEANGSTGFFMREEYSGPLVALMWRSIPDLAPSFRQFAAGLKREVEAHG